MFENLFTRGAILKRYRTAPLVEERLRYLMHCARAGARRKTLREVAAHQVNLVHLLDLRKGERVDVARIEAAAEQWSLPGGRRCGQRAVPQARQRFVGHAVRWLRFANLLEEPARRDTLTPARSRSSQRGCVPSAGGRRRRSEGAATRSIASSIGSMNAELPWLRSALPTSTKQSRAGTPAITAGSRSTITRNVFAPFSGSLNARAGARPGWRTGSCRRGSIAVRQSRRD